jgi:hypothetical protein
VRDGISYVLVPSADGHGEREIQTGLSDGKKIEVVSGLEEGATVLLPEFKMGEKKAGGSPFSPLGGNRSGGRGGH